MKLIRTFALGSLALLIIGCNAQEETPEPKPFSIETWAKGANIKGANGLYFGPDDKLHIASVVTSMILVMDPESGMLTGSYGADKGVENPDDLAFDASGRFCWTGIIPGIVGCIEADGSHNIIAKLGAMTSGPNPITFSDDGRLFAAGCFLGYKLYELDPSGESGEPLRVVTDQLGPKSATEVCGFNGMDFGPDGYLYGPRWFDNEVARLNVENGEFETVVDGFIAPAAVKFDSSGRLHVLDSGAGKLYRIEENGERTLLAELTPGMDNLAFKSDGRLFVSSYADGYVTEVLPNQKLRRISPGGLSMAGSTVIRLRDGKPSLALTDYYSLRYYDLATASEIHTVRGIIDFPGLGTVLSASAAGDNLLLTSWIDQQIKLWDEETESVLLQFNKIGAPIDAAFYNDQIVYTDFATRSVRSLELTSGASPTDHYQSESIPAGLIVGPGDTLYMTEFAELGRLLVIAEGGKWLAEPRVIAEHLWNPEGIFVDATHAYVVESGAQRVTRITLATGEMEAIAEGLSLGVPAPAGMPPTMFFTGIVGDEEGNLYLASDVSNLIYKLAPRAM